MIMSLGNYDEFENYIDIYYPNVVDRVAFEDELRKNEQKRQINLLLINKE